MSTITATPGDLNIIAIEKVNLDNIYNYSSWKFVLRALETKLLLKKGLSSHLAVGCPFSSRHIGNTNRDI